MSPLTEPTKLTLAKGQPVPVDLQGFGSVSLLLHGNADGSGNILDSSLSPKTVSKFGNAASATPPSYPSGNSAFGSAIAFDGTGDYLTAASNASLNFDSGDFTVEAWLYLAGLQTANQDGLRVGTIVAYGVNSVTNSGYSFFVNVTNSQLAFARPGTGTSAVATFAPVLSTWYHIAYTRAGFTNKLFVDGQSLTLTTNTFTPATSSTGTLRIGSERLYSGYIHDLNGYIDELRITKGVARYTSNFTPPTAPFPDF